MGIFDFIKRKKTDDFNFDVFNDNSSATEELINNEDIKSGIYNMADDESISTNDLVLKIATTMSLKPRFLYLPVKMVKYLAMLGDIFPLFPFLFPPCFFLPPFLFLLQYLQKLVYTNKLLHIFFLLSPNIYME